MRLRGWQKIIPYLFISPWIIGFILFTAFPLVFSLFMSFHDWGITGSKVFIGFKNYQNMFADENFYKALSVTLKYSLLLVPLNVLIALVLALLLNTNIKGAGIFKTIFYLPSIISGVALAMIWSWILTDKGILNYLLSLLGIHELPWLRSPKTALWAIVLTTLWSQGSMMIIFLAGLKSIPRHLYEAAEIDGANPFRRFTNVTVPLLSPTIVYNTIMAIIASFQQLTVVINLTNGGPVKSTFMYALYVYQNAFKRFKLGYAAANAWVMFLIILLLTGLVFFISKKWTYYEV